MIEGEILLSGLPSALSSITRSQNPGPICFEVNGHSISALPGVLSWAEATDKSRQQDNKLQWQASRTKKAQSFH